MEIRRGYRLRENDSVTNKYTDHNEQRPFPLCVDIMNSRAAAGVCSFVGSHIRSDDPPVRPDLSWGDQTPHFISWPLLHSPCLFLFLHLLSLPSALAFAVFFSVSARVPLGHNLHP